jgi:hypothetical protein
MNIKTKIIGDNTTIKIIAKMESKNGLKKFL